MDSIEVVGSIIVAIVMLGVFYRFGSGSTYIGRYKVGILTRRVGKTMPPGQVIARNGEVGIQADTLMPGIYWFNPLIWKIEKEQITTIGETEIGTIESIDGEPIPTGRLLGDAVDCNQFQDAKMFLDSGGKKGPQIAILRPGAYRINTRVFKVTKHPVTKIEEENIGIVVAVDGQPLPSGYIIAPKPKNDEHKYYQDGQSFIANGGYRGPQLDTLQPGEYYINPLLFKVKQYEVAEVPPGYVAVLRSNIGPELSESTPQYPVKADKSTKHEIHEKEEVLLTTDVNYRGIWEKPVGPGIYNLNFLALTPYLVPTSAVTIDWAAGTEIRTEHSCLLEKTVGKKKVLKESEIETDRATEFFKFGQLILTSKDGFTLEADVRLIIRIRPQHASFIIARFGSVPNLIEQIVQPLIDSSFRNKAGEKKAIDFIQSRTDIQREALEKAHEEFEKYYVEARNLLLSYIKVDATLLKTQTDREIAIQQQEQFQQQAKAQEENIVVQEKTARAEKQRDVIAAALSIQINKDRAAALIEEATGIKAATMLKADGERYNQAEIGRGLADAYKAQAEVVGPERLAVIKVMEQVASGEVKIVPDLLITGENGKGGNLFNTWLATMLSSEIKRQQIEKQQIEKLQVERLQVEELQVEEQQIEEQQMEEQQNE